MRNTLWVGVKWKLWVLRGLMQHILEVVELNVSPAVALIVVALLPKFVCFFS